jgi:hypothetical protein
MPRRFGVAAEVVDESSRFHSGLRGTTRARTEATCQAGSGGEARRDAVVAAR